METPKVRPIHMENKDPRVPPPVILNQEHDNLLDALSEQIGVQWGIKRPLAEAIVQHYEAKQRIAFASAYAKRQEALQAALQTIPENLEEKENLT